MLLSPSCPRQKTTGNSSGAQHGLFERFVHSMTLDSAGQTAVQMGAGARGAKLLCPNPQPRHPYVPARLRDPGIPQAALKMSQKLSCSYIMLSAVQPPTRDQMVKLKHTKEANRLRPSRVNKLVNYRLPLTQIKPSMAHRCQSLY